MTLAVLAGSCVYIVLLRADRRQAPYRTSQPVVFRSSSGDRVSGRWVGAETTAHGVRGGVGYIWSSHVPYQDRVMRQIGSGINE